MAPRYIKNWMGKNIADALFRHLSKDLEWVTKKTARHEYFMSLEPRNYTYGNRQTGDETYASEYFSLPVDMVRQRLNDEEGTDFNVCFLNKYDDEKQHLGWHADDFDGMRHDQPISVLTLGAEREIWHRKKQEICEKCKGTGYANLYTTARCPVCLGEKYNRVKGKVTEGDRTLLHHGSLFVMPAGYQDEHVHRIPKHTQPCGPRISLTFRSFV